MELDRSISRPTPRAIVLGAPPAQVSAGDLAPAAASRENPLLTACLDGLMRYLLTGCRLHAQRTALLLERAEAEGLGDEALQLLCRRMSERLREGGRLAQEGEVVEKGVAHV
jgi:hypothetical protein